MQSSIPTKQSSPVSLEDAVLIESTRVFVKQYMSRPSHDGSHDYSHIQRVLALAQHILSVEASAQSATSYNRTIVTLGALLHDVGDHKYRAESDEDPETLVQETLIRLGAPTSLAQTVQKIVKNVSFSHERANGPLVQQVLLEHPELAVVQDADRLDALGAVGVGRAFTYGGAYKRDMQQSIDHITEKRVGIEQMMKTAEGKRLAGERVDRLRAFKKWFDEELSFGASIQS